jgi:ADP-ribose pyrophosphatase
VQLTETFQRGEKTFEGKLLQVHRDIVRMPNGREEIREVLRHPGAAVVVPHLGGGRYVLVRQYRYAIGAETVEFPAGRLDGEEDPLACARRELAEETGFTAQRWKLMFRLHPAPGYTDELLYIYLADGLQEGKNHPDADELVESEQATLEQLVIWFQEGKITDAKTAAAILFLKAFPEWGSIY